MDRGIVMNLEHEPGFGSIQPEDGSELVVFSLTDLDTSEPVNPSDPVSYEPTTVPTRKGLQAVNVRPVK
jgi:cold shock CspA family protein